MKIAHFTAATAAAVGLMAAASASALTITYPIPLGDSSTLPAGQVMVANFNQDVVTNLSPTPYDYPTLVGGFTMTLNGATVGYQENTPGYSGGLPDNPITTYLTVIPNGSATLSSSKGIRSFSFYMGSPDNYNNLAITILGGPNQTVSGTTLVAGDTNQQWSWGRRINIDLDGDVGTSVTFSSTGIAFELDNIAVGVVPEPATWAFMIMGFGGAGAMLRRRRAAIA